ncbi:hypothetical protein E1A91_D10G106000v1 [Gossypium mustelinum]|uniref:non-specific serine/threonine protein kinase n=2 Tax=Gossypium TaxID=3633 RepID=A0A5J5PNV6_GOSBA|nr:hypothetical protein ES319_D10G100800v1 [Gossypium barbadense]TYI60462.1 hypothetical protein E1A91_D10G106000v1 [Gossypium mustelinum]
MSSSPENSPSEYSPPASSSSSPSSSSSSPSPSPSPPPPSKSSPPPPPPTTPPPSSPPPPKLSSPPPPAPINKSPVRHPPPPPPLTSFRHPPPPPPIKSSTDHSPPPPTKSGSSKSNNSHKSSPSTPSNDNSGIVFIGVAVGAGLFLLVFVTLLVICCRRRKKKSNQKIQYYQPREAKAGGGDQYYNSSMNRQWGVDGVKTTPSPGGGWGTPSPVPPAGAVGGGGGWGAQSSIPGQVLSGEVSSMSSGPQHTPLPPPSPNIGLGVNTGAFTYEELSTATGGFSQANLLGQGGFGYVHKGVLPNGKEIAVKSLKSGSGQGEREFQAEVEIISRVHHRYLVSLVGYCIARQQRMLVYEFLPNKTLEYHLHEKNLPVMDFPTRLRIALGSAKGLAYLHEDCHPRIIHRDIKSANILLDYNFEAKVADFGLAKLSTDNHTHVSTRVMGTFGYLAPEYASSGKLTEKSDVYSFGVMLLELITGKQPVDPTSAMEDSLVDWARPLLTRGLEDGNIGPLVDPGLENNYNQEEMKRMVACAAASIRHSARKRPKMSQIVRTLEGNSSLDDLNEGVKPGHSSIYALGGTTDYSKSSYDADMKKFRELALSSQDMSESNP